MSLITCVIRFSNGDFWKKKIHKDEDLKKIQKFDFIENENNLKKYLKNKYKEKYNSVLTEEEHMDYDNEGVLFAPYDYGIIFIDFLDKKVYSYNGYTGFMEYDTAKIRFDLKDIKYKNNGVLPENFIDEMKFNIWDYGKDHCPEIINEKLSIDNYNIRSFPYLYNLNKAISKKAKITYCAYEKEDVVLNFSEVSMMLKKIVSIYEDYHGDTNDYYLDKIFISPEDFEIFSSSNLEIEEFYNKIKGKILLNEIENKIWLKYILKMNEIKLEIEEEETEEF